MAESVAIVPALNIEKTQKNTTIPRVLGLYRVAQK